jgi:hypothetical protein
MLKRDVDASTGNPVGGGSPARMLLIGASYWPATAVLDGST